MTAIVGVLNKQAMAIAADSAVTIDSANGHKIFNKANKIFALSKLHPVGIMLYNSATFMGTPWETIIKIYRKELADRSFDTLAEYQMDFVAFLHRKHFYTDASSQTTYVKSLGRALLDAALEAIDTDFSDPPTDEEIDTFVSTLESQLRDSSESWRTHGQRCPEFVDFEFAEFEGSFGSAIDELIVERLDDDPKIASSEIAKRFREFLFEVLCAQENSSAFTGLVFCGFGESEIYPQLIAINVSFAVRERLRYYVSQSEGAAISPQAFSAVRPFAQTDVINTILLGIDPAMQDIYAKNFETFFKQYNEMLLGLIPDEDSVLKEHIAALDASLIAKTISNEIKKVQVEQYIRPLMTAVATLSKEDLAEMAESLIYLTYLKRRITFAEESVGGPVDVAVISKGDGFVWIKRKQYFSSELNPKFSESYH